MIALASRWLDIVPFRAVALAAGLQVLFAAWAGAGDVAMFNVVKSHYYTQAGDAPPGLRAHRPFAFTAEALAATNNSIININLMLPLLGGRGVFPKNPPHPYQYRLFQFNDRSASQSSLDSTYGSGTYTFNVFTRNQGTTNLTISLAGNAYPNTPRLTNWLAAQSINPEAPFQLQWAPMIGGATGDLIRVEIENSTGKVFQTGIYLGESNALNGTATGLTLPAKTLQPGRMYFGRLWFQKNTAFRTNGILGYAGYARQTDFYLATAGAEGMTPPAVVRLLPPGDSVNVPVNAPFMVEFDRPMRSGFTFANQGATNIVRHTWSADRRICWISVNSPWPANTTVTFRLNPLEAGLGFGDTNCVPLPPDHLFRLTFGSSVMSSNAPSPTLFIPSQTVNGTFRIAVQGEPLRGYVLQSTADLKTWESVSTNYSEAAQITLDEGGGAGGGQRFFRVLALPLP